MNQLDNIRDAFVNSGWFTQPGAYVLVDGAFGSCGKGAAAALIALLFGKAIDVATSNAGCNSGHVGYYPLKSTDYGNLEIKGWQKVLSQQIPTVSIVTRALFPMARQLAYLNGGAVLDPTIVSQEALDYGFSPKNLFIHPNAAVIEGHDDSPSTDAIASTNKGVGKALARKVMREQNVAKFRWEKLQHAATLQPLIYEWNSQIVFVETAQGFSLGYDQPFYPFCTSRNCTVGQALADAGIPSRRLNKVLMTMRTHPIRVGNTDKGNSGGWYPDQKEITWEALGVSPELTTVTKRVRRVAIWSWQQFEDAVSANEPDALWIGFMDYIKDGAERKAFISDVLRSYHGLMGRPPDFILGSYGPRPIDVLLEFIA